MNTITIPNALIKEKELVVIPRKQYEEFLRLAGKKKRIYTQFDKNLDETIKEYKAGKYFGPFDNAKNFIKSLKSKK